MDRNRKDRGIVRWLGGGIVVVLVAMAAYGLWNRNDSATRVPGSQGSPSPTEPRNPAPDAVGDDPRSAPSSREQGTASAEHTSSTLAMFPPDGPTAPAPNVSAPRRSPLERSPGYYPPNDPESLSVARGRRDAKPVSMELTGGASSEKGLVALLLAGLSARDGATLQALRVTKSEFATIFWPEFPESRPITNITVDDAWEMQIAQNASGVNRAISGFGGKQLELVRVDHDPAALYTNFKMVSNVRIVTRDISTGEENVLRFAPSFVERHGRFKVLVFKD